MKSKTLCIATRKSPLAMWQANHIKDKLQALWPELKIELIPMQTSGDKFQIDKLQSLGGKGLFIKELEEALLDGRADIAVHSTKDMPATCPEGLSIAVFCKRESPFDALVSPKYKHLNELPKKSIIGTASLRRKAQLLAYRPDLVVHTLRGNVNTRLKKLNEGQFDAIVLAESGLNRLGFQDIITQTIDEQIMLPACGQGALCIETRTEDEAILKLIAPLKDEKTTHCVNTERSVNAQLGGNCHVPVAVYCTFTEKNELLLRAKILSEDGTQCVQSKQTSTINNAMQLANDCVASLNFQGGQSILDAL